MRTSLNQLFTHHSKLQPNPLVQTVKRTTKVPGICVFRQCSVLLCC
ncbi:hypothetical protein FQN60_008595 [Etheostoma spectabile]|uniref:Uncharacterized protein n=1 Tax=Etheostoma spectabile TaxID=54343 RepID=A0A5J5CM07_9PERO|nr:hypothetical protein FQN60_008595 [Etheostoma spectabile]